MVQVKKTELREAILMAAFDLFCRKGYTASTMAEIARAADMTVANLYVYFDSKLEIFYAIYTPWLLAQLETLRNSVRKFRTPRTRLRRLIIGIWGDIPAADHSFANAMVEALASSPEGTAKPNDLLARCESFVIDLIAESLPPEHANTLASKLFVHVLWMAYDGFAINSRFGDACDLEAIVTLMLDLILGPETAQPPARKQARCTRAAV